MSRPRICTWIVWRLATEASAKSSSPRVESILVYGVCFVLFPPLTAAASSMTTEGGGNLKKKKKTMGNFFLYLLRSKYLNN
jgi:hypothetical protein